MARLSLVGRVPFFFLLMVFLILFEHIPAIDDFPIHTLLTISRVSFQMYIACIVFVIYLFLLILNSAFQSSAVDVEH